MVEVVGTAPTSAMFITRFVYRHSWKTNNYNIKLFFGDSITLFKMKLTKEQKQEITDQQSQKNETKRVTSPELEKILYEALPVLDHGFVRVVDYMGDDTSIVQSARVSYGKGTKKVSTDEGLIKYLMRHWHSTPFEMCEIKYHVKLPIFIARQWIRHRTANVNEYSARYSILDKEFYIPAKEQLSAQSTSNRQGRGDLITGDQADEVLKILKDDATRTYDNYEKMLNEKFDGTTIDEGKAGLARELARMNLTLNSYTQWYWKTDLLKVSFLGFGAPGNITPLANFQYLYFKNFLFFFVFGWLFFLRFRFNFFLSWLFFLRFRFNILLGWLFFLRFSYDLFSKISFRNIRCSSYAS